MSNQAIADFYLRFVLYKGRQGAVTVEEDLEAGRVVDA